MGLAGDFLGEPLSRKAVCCQKSVTTGLGSGAGGSDGKSHSPNSGGLGGSRILFIIQAMAVVRR